jgi:hypothetical protein
MQQVLPRSAFQSLPVYAVRPSRSLSGFGDARTDQMFAGMATSTVTSALPALVSSGLLPESAVPFIGAGLAIASVLAQYIIANSGCGQTCIQTSQWANQAANALQQVLDGYFAQPAPRAKSAQQLALASFDQIWAKLVQLCGDPQWGDAGKRCISDRQRGACVWKQAYAPVYPGEPAIGQCWNWFNGYRDPIANDTDVVDDSALATVNQVGSDVAGVVSQAGAALSSASPLLLVGGGLLALALLTGGKN